MPIPEALRRFSERKDQYLTDLENLIRIPSVSFAGFDRDNVRTSARATAALLKERGFDNVQLLEIEGAHPYAYGEVLKAPGKPTLLLYAHHDVQPAGDAQAWQSPPFEPTRRNGRLFGRGSADDKGGIVVHTSAVDAWLGAGPLPLNIKLIVEGEEEIGSTHLAEFLRKHAKLLAADAIVLTDTTNFETGLPSITTVLRGLVTCDVELCALKQSLHSGMWGGPVPDPAMGLCRLLASLTNPDGSIAIAGIADKVRPLTAQEKKDIAALPGNEAHFRSQSGLLPGVEILGGRNTWESIWRQPSIAVNAIPSEHAQRRAQHHLRVGLGAHRHSHRAGHGSARGAAKAHRRRLKERTPWGLECRVREDHAASWWYDDATHPAFQAALSALEKGYGKGAVTIGCGATIPFVEPFSRELGGVPALLIGVEDPYTNAHSENESLDLGDWEKAVKSAIYMYQELADALSKR